MKKFLVTLCSLIYFVSSAFAGTVFISPGTKSGGMGEAFTAVCDDITTIYWNPAGLTQLKGTKVQFSTFYIDADVKSNTSLSNISDPTDNSNAFPLSKILSTEPSEYESKIFATKAVLPFVGGHTKLNKKWTLGVGVYAIGGGGGEWEDIAEDSYASVDGSYGFIVGNVSCAKKVSSKVSLGAGLNFVYMQDEAVIEKSFGVDPYTVKFEKDASGSNVEFTGGILYKPIKELKFGATIRSGAEIKIKGTANFDAVNIPPTVGGVDIAVASKYTERYHYPFTYAVGGACELTKKLTLAVDFQVADYSKLEEKINYMTPLKNVFVNQNRKKNWSDTVVSCVGLNYKCNKKLSLQLGLRHDPSPYPEENLNLLNTDQYTLTSLTFGTHYKVGTLELGVNYVRNFSDEPTLSGREYEYSSNSFRFSVTKKM